MMGLGERSAVSVFPRALCASRRTVLVEEERERERIRLNVRRRFKMETNAETERERSRRKRREKEERATEASSLFFSLYLLLSVFRFHFYSRRSSIEHVMMRKSDALRKREVTDE